jgi:hypothetical protein
MHVLQCTHYRSSSPHITSSELPCKMRQKPEVVVSKRVTLLNALQFSWLAHALYVLLSVRANLAILPNHLGMPQIYFSTHRLANIVISMTLKLLKVTNYSYVIEYSDEWPELDHNPNQCTLHDTPMEPLRKHHCDCCLTPGYVVLILLWVERNR